MSIEFRYDGVLLDPERVRLPPNEGGVAGLPGAAFNGEVGTAGITVEDPDGDLDLVGLHEFTVDETDCAKPRIFTGWLYGRGITRGPNYRTGPGRVWICDIVDQNFAWGLKVFRASSAKRPAESDNTRMRFMLESAPMAATPVYDNGLFNTTDNPINFGDADYVTQYPVELAVSVAGTSGKNFYAYWDDTADQISGYYDLVTAVVRTSTLRVSNVIADQDAVTFYPTVDAEMARSPENVHSGILLGYRGGFVYLQRAETITDFIDRDRVHRTDRIGYESTALSVAASMLEAMSVEQDTIRVTIRVPSSQVNLAKEGEWMEVKFTHLPGLESFTQLPIIRRNVNTTERRDRYDITLELSSKAPDRGPGGGGTVILPHRPCGATTGDLVQSVSAQPLGTPPTVSLPSAPSVGNTIIVYEHERIPGAGNPEVPIGFTDSGAGLLEPHEEKGRIAYRYVESGDTAAITWTADAGDAPTRAYVEERLGRLNVETASLTSTDPYNTNSPFPGAAITPTSGLPGAIVSYIFMKRDHGALAADTGWSLLDAATDSSVSTHAVIGKDVSSTSGTYSPSFTGANPAAYDNHNYASITVALLCTGGGTVPPTGQWVYRETVTLTGAVGTTAFPYADDSLIVRVDGVLISSASYTESDPETGEFTLDWEPDSDEVVTVDYQAR